MKPLRLLPILAVALSCATVLAPAARADLDSDGLNYALPYLTYAPGTVTLKGAVQGRPVLLRLAPRGAGVQGSYFYYAAQPVRINWQNVAGGFAAGRLKLASTSFDWEKGAVSNRPAFEIDGVGSLSALRGAGQLQGRSMVAGAKGALVLTPVAGALPAGTKVSVKQLRKSFPAESYTVDFRYPALTGNSAAVKKFNRAVELLAFGSINRARQYLKEYPVGGDRQLMMHSAGACDFTYVSPRFISLDFYFDDYLGGAHGSQGHAQRTFDFQSGRFLELSDVFKPNIKPLEVLASLCRPALHQALAGMEDAQWLQTGSAPTKANYANWNLTPVGMTVTFGNYQVAPYAFGESTILIPFAKLQPYLRAEFLRG